MNRRSIIIGAIILALVVAGAVWAFGRGNGGQATTTPKPSVSIVPSQTSEQSGDVTSPGPSNGPYAVKVYFSKHPQSDDDPSATFPVGRTSPDIGVATYAVSQLVAGPSSAEKASGYFSNLRLSGPSNCSGQDFALTIGGGTASLRFCRDAILTGIISDGQIESTIAATLKQFPEVKKVVILRSDGNCLFDAAGNNACKR